MEQHGVSVEMAASYSDPIDGESASAHTKISNVNKQVETFNQETEHRMKFTIGSKPPKDDSQSTWAQQTFDNPMPIKYSIQPLDELVPEEMVPNIKRAYKDFCETLKARGKVDNCERAIDGARLKTIFPTFRHSEIEGADDGKTTCLSGDKALYCGYQPKKSVGKFEPHAKVHITSDGQACLCYNDQQSAQCSAVCVNKQIKVTRVSQNAKGEFKVVCPAGTKVTSCNYDNNGDHYPAAFPIKDQNACQCILGSHNTGGDFATNCYANCVAETDVSNYNVLSQYKEGGVAEVKCPSGTSVLGCGAKARYQSSRRRNKNKFEQWPATYATKEQSCKCYNWFGVNCYAVCGTLH